MRDACEIPAIPWRGPWWHLSRPLRALVRVTKCYILLQTVYKLLAPPPPVASFEGSGEGSREPCGRPARSPPATWSFEGSGVAGALRGLCESPGRSLASPWRVPGKSLASPLRALQAPLQACEVPARSLASPGESLARPLPPSPFPFEPSLGAWRAKRRWPGWSAEHIPGQTAVLKRAWGASSRGRSLHQESP